MAGALFLVVGQSGVGKDTLLDGARAALAGSPDFVFVRRVITRPADAGGEDHDVVGTDEFARRKANGAFLFSWSAHGLDYALPIELANDLAQGRHVVANGSRDTIAALAPRVPQLVIIEIVADPGIVRGRLKARGREMGKAIVERMTRVTAPIPANVERIEVSNDADVVTGVKRLLAALMLRAAAAAGQRTAKV
jgi:thymidine phosphorylase